MIYRMYNILYKLQTINKQRAISLLLTLSLCLGLAPPVYATENIEVSEDILEEYYNSEIFEIETAQEETYLEELFIDAVSYKASAGSPPAADLSNPDGIRASFLKWYDYSKGKEKSNFTQILLSDAKEEIKNESIELFEENGKVWGVQTLDEFLPSAIKVYKNPKRHSEGYTLAWLFETVNGNGVEYKASNQAYFEADEKLDKASDPADIYFEFC